MVGVDKESNKSGGGNGSESGTVVLNGGVFTASKSAFEVQNGSAPPLWTSGDGLRTYKRRKRTKTLEGMSSLENSAGRVSEKAQVPEGSRSTNGTFSQMQLGIEAQASEERRSTNGTSPQMPSIMESIEKSLEGFPCFNSSTQAGGSQNDSCGVTNHGMNCSLEQESSLSPEQIRQKLEGWDRRGNRAAIKEQQTNNYQEQLRQLWEAGRSGNFKAAFEELVHSLKNGDSCPLKAGVVRNWVCVAKNNVGITSHGSAHELSDNAVRELCQRSFLNVIISEKFCQLRNLFLENFEGATLDKLFDLNQINARINEGVYDKSPSLFHKDLQQIWLKLEQVGNNIITLAKSLSKESASCFGEQFFPQEADTPARGNIMEACAIYGTHNCQRCGEKVDGRDCLVCDACEQMHHVSCIEPPVKEIPLRTWYCASCTAKGIQQPHDDCLACERLNDPGSPIDGNGNNEEKVKDLKLPNGLVLDQLQLFGRGKDFPTCKTCRAEVRNDDKYIICGHSLCPHKFYHERCLTETQLCSHGPCWYCPSCLCRACLTDKDDDKIVLCDGCDHAYHIYCMDPPRTSIPKGKWFCGKCDGDINCLHKTKQKDESLSSLKKSKKRAWKRKETHAPSETLQKDKSGEASTSKSGGVDMLLNAAKTLNYEENLAARKSTS